MEKRAGAKKSTLTFCGFGPTPYFLFAFFAPSAVNFLRLNLLPV